MTPDELKSIRQSLGLSADALAKTLRVFNRETVYRWEAGEREIPGPVEVIMEGLRDNAHVRRYLKLPGGLTKP